ncbi:MAG: hypothetical protein A2017_05030 [Lentisphaerae bacterium GWF2_44_16]|nr:MAG: hypothetical protein A2017_05030 [Lentisphaerae bacterium GWF2_44_16]
MSASNKKIFLSENSFLSFDIPEKFSNDKTMQLAKSELETLFTRRFGKGNPENKIKISFKCDEKVSGCSVKASKEKIKFKFSAPLTALYAVYDFAEEYLGYCFFEPGRDIISETSKSVKLPAGKLLKPSKLLLKRRGLVQEFPFSEESFILADWMAKNKLNYILVWMKYYDKATPEMREYFQVRGIEIESGHHNFSYWIPGEKYAKSNPDYFAIINGQRISPSSSKSTLLLSEQLCTTNPELRAEIAKRMSEYMKAHPELKTISLLPNDGFGWCECPECSKFYDKNKKGDFYSVSKHVYKADKIYHDMVREISDKLHASNPETMLTFAAYINYCAPSPGFKLHKNTAVHFAPYWRCVNHLIDDKNCWLNSAYFKDLKAWVKAKDGGEVNIYEYIMGINFYISLPLIFHETIFDEIKTYSKLGVDGFLTQFHIPHWTAYGQNFYMMAKAAYGADRKKSVKDFFRKVFGAEHTRTVEKLYAQLLHIQKSSGPCLVTYPRALFKRTDTKEYRKAHELSQKLALECPDNDFARRLVIWTEYILKFKELFDKYHAGKSSVGEIEDFLKWCMTLRKDRVLVTDRVEMYFKAWLECARTGKEWIHFNLDWEDKYVKLHDTLLNEKKPDLSRCII